MKIYESLPVVNNIQHGVLLDGYWHPDNIGFFCVFYDMNENRLVQWLDVRFQKIIRVRGRVNVAHHHCSYRQMIDPLTLQPVNVTNIVLDHPFESINKLNLLPKLPESHLYFILSQSTPGAYYEVNQTMIPITQNIDSDSIRKKLLGETDELISLAEENMPILNDEVPKVPMLVFDIEVASPRNVFPVPEHAEYPVISVGIAGNNRERIVLLLDDKGIHRKISMDTITDVFTQDDIDLDPNIDKNLNIQYFDTEEELLIHLFEFMNAPFILTFNGDTFDLPYLFYRAKKLGIESPIVNSKKTEFSIKGSIHIDLYLFLRQQSIRLYAFGGKYSSYTLDAISNALLGVRKVEHEAWFDEMNTLDLIHYTIRDAVITLKLIEFDDGVLWFLIVLLMRLGKVSLPILNRRKISAWLLQWVAFNHERMGYIIPPYDELQEQKGGFQSSAGIDGKQFEGAIVLKPIPGVWWGVIVYDFASLYPSIIKVRNIGYDTVRCEGHSECKANKVPELDHWICTRYTSIMSSLVGYVRDLRVKWYKGVAKTTDDPQKKKLYTLIQSALKVFINASYGVFGTSSFPLFCPPAAETTTALARNALLTFKNLVEERGIKAVYGDTDSLFLHGASTKIMNEVMTEMLIQHGMELGIDYNFKVLFLTDKKKNYFGVTTKGTTIVKGLQGKKSNTPEVFKKLFNDILRIYESISDESDFEIIREKVLNRVKFVYNSLHSQILGLEDLKIEYSISKPLDEYMVRTPAVMLAILSCNEDPGLENTINEGSKFFGVKTNDFSVVITTLLFPNLAQKKGDLLPCNVKPINITDKAEVDWKGYEKMMETIITPLLSPLGILWEKDIKGQMVLDSFF